MRKGLVISIFYVLIGVGLYALIQFYAGGLGILVSSPIAEFIVTVVLWPLILVYAFFIVSGGR